MKRCIRESSTIMITSWDSSNFETGLFDLLTRFRKSPNFQIQMKRFPCKKKIRIAITKICRKYDSKRELADIWDQHQTTIETKTIKQQKKGRRKEETKLKHNKTIPIAIK